MANNNSDAVLADQALSEREKMIKGLPYLAMADPQLVQERLRARPLLQKYNMFAWPAVPLDVNEMPDYFGPKERKEVLAELFGLSLEEVEKLPLEIEPPFIGTNIKFQGPFYCNFNCHLLDCATITIGHRVVLAPNVHLYAATHSTDVAERSQGLERAYPITIGDDVWIGGNSCVVGPCTIGNGVTIAAGAVVTGNIPDNVVVGGVPARIIKHLNGNPADRPQDLRDRLGPAPDGTNELNGTGPSKKSKKSKNSRKAKAAAAAANNNLETPEIPSPELTPEAATAAATATPAAVPAPTPREPIVVDPTVDCFLANVPSSLPISALRATLKAFGPLKHLTVDKRHRFGFVTFVDPEAAAAAVEAGRGEDGLLVSEGEGEGEAVKSLVVGIEQRRAGGEEGARAFNVDLITGTTCALAGVYSGIPQDELKIALENLSRGKVVALEVGETDGWVEFERVGEARRAVKASVEGEGAVVGEGKVKVLAKRKWKKSGKGKKAENAQQESQAANGDTVGNREVVNVEAGEV